MILNRYEIFLKTAEIGNITKTAEILHYTQAGISHAIAALEKETGFSLLARSASGVTLTENGKRLLLFFVKHFSLKKASEFPVFSEGFSLL